MRVFVSKKTLEQDAIPSQDIQVSKDLQQDLPWPAENILLTGVTGFLGTSLLNSLLKKTHANIYCLIRSKNEETIEERLNKQLKAHQLERYIGNDRIIPIAGDLNLSRLGLTDTLHDIMVDRVDTIYHNGAHVNYFYSYLDLKTANVTSTEDILRMSVTKKLKRVHYISTLFLFFPKDCDGKSIIYEDDEPPHGVALNIGYGQTKWVADSMIRYAQTRGIPATIYRVTRMSADSQLGNCNNNDFIWNMLMISIQVQSRPSTDMLINFAPVDFVSDAIVEISFQKESEGKIFHIANPHSITMDEFFEMVRELGYPLPKKSLNKWKQDVLNYAERTGNRSFSIFIDILNKMTDGGNRAYDVRNMLEKLKTSSLSCPMIEKEFIKTNLMYFLKKLEK
ncbi:thioester reductase domain-containing protein [bacterium]|nr:thioester reductase domain-containing protein [bacterium]